MLTDGIDQEIPYLRFCSWTVMLCSILYRSYRPIAVWRLFDRLKGDLRGFDAEIRTWSDTHVSLVADTG
jgi:hypothetical protein